MESLATGRPFARRMRVQHGDGRPRVLDARGDVVYDDAGEAVGLQGFSQDITELARAEQRQRAVAELGQRALEGAELDALLQHAVDAVGREIGVDGVGVLEVLPGGEQALIRALAARPDARRPATIAIEPGGVVDRALTRREPVVVADLLADPEIEISALERQGGARSVAVVVIDGQTRPFGVLGAMSERPDHFNEDDAAFLSAIANVLADAVERRAGGGRDRGDLRRARPAGRAGDRRRGPRAAQHLRGAARRRPPGAAGRPQRALRAWPAAAATTPRSRPRRSA